MKPVVLLLLDALRWDYVSPETTPFLARAAAAGAHYRRVRPSFGFCERSEILSGRGSAETGWLTAIGYAPSRSPYRGQRNLRAWQAAEHVLAAGLAPMGAALRDRALRRFRRVFATRAQRRGIWLAPYRIPLTWLPFWALTEDERDLWEPHAVPGGSLFDDLRAAGRGWCADAFTSLRLPDPGDDAARLARALQRAPDPKVALHLVYIAQPDTLGHRLGPDALGLRAGLRLLDAQLANFVSGFARARPETTFVFVGDHGMLPVRARFDAERELRRIAAAQGAQVPRDLLFFLDSTMVRVWSMGGTGRGAATLAALQTDEEFLQVGRFLDGAARAALGLRPDDRRYGDLLWVANPGVLVFPDFFHRANPPRGMHGYDPGLPESHGTCIVTGAGATPQSIPEIRLAEVCGVLRRALELA